MIRLAPILFGLFLGLCATTALAEDIEGAADHPRIPRMPGYNIVDYEANDFGKYEFYRSDEEMVTLEGRFWSIYYEVPEGTKPKGPLEIARNYASAFAAKGGGGYDGSMDNSGGTAYAWLTEPERETWIEIKVSNDGEIYTLTIVERAGLKQQVELGADAIVKALDEQGSIALYGINFDTGKSDLRPDSEAALKAIADALKARLELKIEIGGHTDDVGDDVDNQTLSDARAATVKRALIERFGIADARLVAKGFGETKPVTPNDNDEARAKNRRVELVKLPS